MSGGPLRLGVCCQGCEAFLARVLSRWTYVCYVVGFDTELDCIVYYGYCSIIVVFYVYYSWVVWAALRNGACQWAVVHKCA